MPPIASTSGRLHSEFVSLLFLQAHRETDLFLQLQEFCQWNQIVDSSTTAASSNNPVYVRHVDLSSLGSSLSSHRQSYIGLVFRSRFIDLIIN
jgi:hypothetical protein